MTTQQRTLARAGHLALLAGLVLFGSTPGARADFMDNYTGNTGTGTPTTIQGTYNFAVLDQTTTNKSISGYYLQSNPSVVGDTWGAAASYTSNSPRVVNGYANGFDQLFQPGIGSGPLDTSNRYLYLVEVTNNGTSPNSISTVTIANVAGLVGSYGIFAGSKTTGTGDSQGPVTLSNDLGPDNHPFDGNAYAPTTRPYIQSETTTSGNTPTGATVAMVGNNLVVTFTGGLANGSQSVLIGFTSDSAPQIQNGAFTFSGSAGSAGGQAPLPAPEPSAPALVGMGIGCCALFLRRRVQKPTVATA